MALGCCPMTALLPIIFILWKPLYSLLPKPLRNGIEYILKLFGLINDNNKNDFIILESENQWKQFLDKSKNNNYSFIAYFTDLCCGDDKCDIIKEYSSKIDFIKVNMAKFKDIANETKVDKLPTFQLYKKGELVDSVNNMNPQTLKILFDKA